jgi:hypothetical protein
MEQQQPPKVYERPEIVDYGTLVELTAGHGGHHHEDGLHKNHDASHPHR